jgi:hypothetical protein
MNAYVFALISLLILVPAYASAQRPVRCNSPHILESLPTSVYKATLGQRDEVNALTMNPRQTNRQLCHQYWRIPVVFHVIHNRSVDSINALQVKIRFRTPENGVRIEIRDVMGSKVAGFEMEEVAETELQIELDLSELGAGVYFMKMNDFRTGLSGGNFKLLKVRQ